VLVLLAKARTLPPLPAEAVKDITMWKKKLYFFPFACVCSPKHCTITDVYPDCWSCLCRKPQDAEMAPETNQFSWQRVMLILELLQHKKKLRRPQALVPALFNLLSR